MRSTVRWFAMPSAHAAAEAAAVEEFAQCLGEGRGVGDFAVSHDVCVERGRGDSLGDHAAVAAGLYGRDESGLHVEPDDVPSGTTREADVHFRIRKSHRNWRVGSVAPGVRPARGVSAPG